MVDLDLCRGLRTQVQLVKIGAPSREVTHFSSSHLSIEQLHVIEQFSASLTSHIDRCRYIHERYFSSLAGPVNSSSSMVCMRSVASGIFVQPYATICLDSSIF